MTEENFPEWLRGEMEKRNWDVKQLANRSWVCDVSIRKFLRGAGLPSLYTFFQLLDAFGLEIKITEKQEG